MKKRLDRIGGGDGIICILCPKGCRAEVKVNGERIGVGGKLCKRGIPYVQEEFKNPKRILTTTMRTEESLSRLLPVRTRGPIPKKNLKKAVALLSRIRVSPPIKVGQVILTNILETGQDIIASDDLRM